MESEMLIEFMFCFFFNPGLFPSFNTAENPVSSLHQESTMQYPSN